ncbi:MAG: IPTL-CTERM sorting domain-containing protein [Dokdonella sp.]
MRKTIHRSTLAASVALLLGSSPAWAIYVNGGFETGDYTGWTIGGGINPGLSGSPPFTGANIVISGSSPGPATVVGAIVDPRAPTVLLPRAGTLTAKLSDENGGQTITTMTQVDTLTAADIDPGDGMPHVRFAFAPVLEDPGHTPDEQPYFYVSVTDMATSTVLFEQFAYSGQPGVTYLTGAGSFKYLDFQDIDVVLPIGSIGSPIELRVVAAKCALSGHGGYVYVDGFGSAAVPPPGGGVPYFYEPVPAVPPVGLALLGGLLAAAGVWFRRRQRG